MENNISAENELKKVAAAIDGLGLKYEKLFKGLGMGFGLTCGRLPVSVNIMVAPETELVRFTAVLSLLFPPSTIEVGLEEVAKINYTLAFGHFDIDPFTGKLFFNATLAYKGCETSVDTYREVFENCFYIIDRYSEELGRKIKP